MTSPARKFLTLVQVDNPNAIDRAIQEFLQAKAGKAPKTVQGYRGILYQFRAHAGAHFPPTPAAIDQFLVDCKARDLKDTTIDDYYRGIKTWLAWLYKRGKISQNPIELVERPPRPKLIPRAPRPEDLQKLFDHLETVANKGKGHWLDVRALAIWSLALDTGLRIGEVASLSINDITIHKGRRLAHVRGRKTHMDRVVVFDKRTAKDLKYWLKARARLPLPSGLEALFVCYVRGEWKAIGPPGIRQALHRCCRDIGLPHITPHDFRHAYAIYSLRNRSDLLDIQKQMGHQNIATTARYTLVDDSGRAKRHKGSSPRGNKLR